MLYARSQKKADYSHENQVRLAIALEASQKKMLSALASLPAVAYQILEALCDVTRSSTALASRVVRAVETEGKRIALEDLPRDEQIRHCLNLIASISGAYSDVVGEGSVFAVDHGFAILNRRALANTLGTIQLYDRFLQNLANQHGPVLEESSSILRSIEVFCSQKVQLPDSEIRYLVNSSELLANLKSVLPARARKHGLQVHRHEIGLLAGQVTAYQAKHHVTLLDAVRASKTLQEGLTEFKATLDEMISNNIGLVISMGGANPLGHIDGQDLQQEAIAGLMRACVLYDYRRENTFATFAGPWIKQAITRTLDNSRTVSVPDRLMVIKRSIQRMDNLAFTSQGKVSSIADVAKEMGIDQYQAGYLRGIQNNTLSLNSCLQDSENEFVDLVESEYDEFDPEKQCEASDLHAKLQQLIGELTAREQYIVNCRFGITGKEMTLEEVGSTLGLSIERVRQIEQKALSRMAKLAEDLGVNLRGMIA